MRSSELPLWTHLYYNFDAAYLKEPKKCYCNACFQSADFANWECFVVTEIEVITSTEDDEFPLFKKLNNYDCCIESWEFLQEHSRLALFLLGFVCPLLWIVGVLLPLPKTIEPRHIGITRKFSAYEVKSAWRFVFMLVLMMAMIITITAIVLIGS